MEPIERQIIPSVQRLAILAHSLAVGGPFVAPTVMCYKNSIVLNAATALADLVPCDFDGYAPVVGMIWDAPYIDVDGSALVFGASITIVSTGSVTPNTVFGYALVNVGVTVLLAAYALVPPVGISAPSQAVSFVPAIRISGT